MIVTTQGMEAIGSLDVLRKGGHTGVVRNVFPMSNKHIDTTQSQGIFGLGVLASTYVDFVDAVWLFEIFIVM